MSKNQEVLAVTSVRRNVALWFLAVSTLLLLAGILGFQRLRGEMVRIAAGSEEAAVASVVEQLTTADAVYRQLTTASRKVLEAEATRYGAASIRGNAAIAASIQITWDLGWSGHIVESHQMHERKAHTMEYFGYLRLFETLS